MTEASKSPGTRLIFGCGYLGRHVAKLAKISGNSVWATTRDPRKAGQIASLGATPIVADWLDRDTIRRLPEVDQIVIAVSYDRNSPRSRFDSQVGGLRNLLEFLPPKAHICYISTTGVYHQRNGVWVDEDSPAEPTREGGQVHLQAEQLLDSLSSERRPTVLRLSGIYGPGRVPRAADVRAGKPISAPQDGYLNLIHVDDAAQAVIATLHSAVECLYVVSDDAPVIRGDFYREIARQCGVAAPVFSEPRTDSPVSVRAESNKRVRNSRMKRDLVHRLLYPTYREGLADVLLAE